MLSLGQIPFLGHQLTALTHTQASVDASWVVETGTALPFGGRARTVEAVVAVDPILNGSGQQVFYMPEVETNYGPDKNQIRLIWPEPVKGKIRAMVRMDNPSV